MELYLDSAELSEVKHLSSLGLIKGVTTNPSLIKKAAGNFSEKCDLGSYLKELVKASPGPLSVEVLSTDVVGMCHEAVQLHDLFFQDMYFADKLVVKIPVCTISEMKDLDWASGLEATRKLSEKGIKVNSTLIMSPSQAMLAAYAGASYVSPFAGRIDDALTRKYRYNTKLSSIN